VLACSVNRLIEFIFVLDLSTKMNTTSILMYENMTTTTTAKSFLTSNVTTMSELSRLWYQMFLSTLISSIILHSIGAFVLFMRLRKNSYTKWLVLVILLTGILTPLTLGSINNILIASILVFSSRFDLPFYATILIGLGQTIFIILVGFLKLMQTL
jgi:hypothetical protein